MGMPRKKRGEAALAGFDPFQELLALALEAKAKGDQKEIKDLAIQLLPYTKAKLKQVDITQAADVKVTVVIGGDDANN